MSPRIAIVDDDPLLRELVVDYLSGQGYAALPCNGGTRLRALFASSPPDWVILDLVMPGEDGLSVLRRCRPVMAQPAVSTAPAPPAMTAQDGESWFGRWRLERAGRRLVDPRGEILPITGAEFGLLCAFAEHPNVILSRDKLLELSGTDPGAVFDRAIDLRITRLRKKIEPVPGDPTVIRTVRGHGGGYQYLPSNGSNYGR